MERARPDGAGLSRRLMVWGAVFAIFAAYSLLHARIPGAGEGHYLTKAKHFYDPSWCAGDLFLESSNPHWMFYATMGGLTRILSLEATAWIGRALGIGLVAAGWVAMVRRITGSLAAPIPAAIIYIGIASIGNFSGEWLLDGVEGKLFSYGFLFLAIAWYLDGILCRAAAAAGLAIAFHPVVGGWGLVAAAIADVLSRCTTCRETAPADEAAASTSSATKPSWRYRLTALVILGLCSLPGVIPAIASLRGGSTARADWIQIFYRLPHHLDPMTFSREAWIGYAVLVIVGILARWLASRTASPTDASERWFTQFVLGTIVIAAAGLIVGWGERPATPSSVPVLEWRMRLMKFYPFRLVDLFVPVSVAISLARLWAIRASRRAELRAAVAGTDAARPRPAWVDGVLLAALLGAALWNATNTQFRPRVPDERVAAWRDVCAWIRAETPAGALFLAPNEAWAFRWFAERPEYVSFKDCPQDAAGILEWNRRLKFIQSWFDAEWNGGLSSDSLRRLRAETGIRYLLLRDSGAFDVPPVYRNGIYAVHAIPE